MGEGGGVLCAGGLAGLYTCVQRWRTIQPHARLLILDYSRLVWAADAAVCTRERNTMLIRRTLI